MNPTNIEWTDYTWNPITGCSRGCYYCYAQKMAYRLRGRYGYPQEDPFQVTFHSNRLRQPGEVKKPSKIFVCSMGEIFDPKALYVWHRLIWDVFWDNPHHTFQILTKRPKMLSDYVYPSNVWIGITIDGLGLDQNRDLRYLRELGRDNVKYVSFEPLLNRVEPDLSGIDWVIIGGCTGSKPFTPPEEWVSAITERAREHGCAVFHKDNLGYGWVKEFPSSKLKETPK